MLLKIQEFCKPIDITLISQNCLSTLRVFTWGKSANTTTRILFTPPQGSSFQSFASTPTVLDTEHDWCCNIIHHLVNCMKNHFLQRQFKILFISIFRIISSTHALYLHIKYQWPPHAKSWLIERVGQDWVTELNWMSPQSLIYTTWSFCLRLVL